MPRAFAASRDRRASGAELLSVAIVIYSNRSRAAKRGSHGWSFKQSGNCRLQNDSGPTFVGPQKAASVDVFSHQEVLGGQRPDKCQVGFGAW
jgi:hypothetical protein